MSDRYIKYSVVTSAPSVEPITTSEAKSYYLKEDLTDNDAYIPVLIKAARQWVEERTGRSLITQTRAIKLDKFVGSCITLTYGPVQSVSSITYYDDDDVEQTLSSSEYVVDTSSEIARIEVVNSWPSTYDKLNAIAITYVAGYGATASSVPQALVHAVGAYLKALYDSDQKDQVELAERLLQLYILEQDVTL